uniref:Secreted protein n=2 Tax=Bursaphelenchus xylophilus TaxID=6326 RepID=A0A1I7RHL1_BURXY
MHSLVITTLLLAAISNSVIGLGYIYEDAYYPIPRGSQIVVEAPSIPDEKVIPQRRFDPAWRHIGLGKRTAEERRTVSGERSWAMIGLGR